MYTSSNPNRFHSFNTQHVIFCMIHEPPICLICLLEEWIGLCPRDLGPKIRFSANRHQSRLRLWWLLRIKPYHRHPRHHRDQHKSQPIHPQPAPTLHVASPIISSQYINHNIMRIAWPHHSWLDKKLMKCPYWCPYTMLKTHLNLSYTNFKPTKPIADLQYSAKHIYILSNISTRLATHTRDLLFGNSAPYGSLCRRCARAVVLCVMVQCWFELLTHKHTHILNIFGSRAHRDMRDAFCCAIARSNSAACIFVYVW